MLIITHDFSRSATLLKGLGSGFPSKWSMTLLISQFHSFQLNFLRQSPICMMSSSNLSILPSIQHFLGSAIDLNLCSSSTTLGKFHNSGGLRMFYDLRELSMVFICLRVQAADFSSQFCLYFLGSILYLINESQMS